ncbi:MAG: SDR family oxidoreductase [Acidimicrobiales bacterium]|jgi:NAD(P)-dependent dehydrogenase (short-subunit alcohol dehydrogenase family)|nr:SDR family oxidoreductase [Acidimicrobiales bacterium]
MLLEGKVAVLSGLGPNLGRQVALALAREGADLVLAARREKRLQRSAEEVEALGRRVLCVPTDITDKAACEALAAQTRETFGKADILVNNAFHDGTFTSFEDSDLDHWQVTFDVNFWGTLRLTQAFLPLLKERDDARIVMVNTMSMQKIEPNFGAYAASKGALATVTKTLAVELGPHGIRVNGVHPGYIYGAAVEWYLNDQADKRGVTFQDVYDELASETCLRYLPPAEEIAGAVVFFASPLARAVTGQALPVNAGHWIG